MKKVWIFVIVGFLLVVTAIGVGGKIYMDKRAEQKEAEKIEAERMSVEALKNTFKNIKSVEFEQNEYNVMAGSYFMVIKMTDQNSNIVTFGYTFEKGDDEVGYIIEDKEVQVEGVTKNKVKVIYSNIEEGEV